MWTYDKMKIAFDVGGVISKYPDTFRELIRKLEFICTVYIISDMHPVESILETLELNNICVDKRNVFSADYAKYGEHCKTKLCEELGIDILIDDFMGYLADGDYIRLLVMPDSSRPYWHDTWKVKTESDFGRRKFNV